ncbi:hypothetical protein OB13_13675, partial [Pontibacter sp. HJ8]
MHVLIVSKTQMSNAICVGAVTDKGRSVRLLTDSGYNQSHDTDFEIKEVWDITYKEREHKVAPHIEDILVLSKKYIGTSEMKMIDLLAEVNAPIWRGSPNTLFGGLLNWTSNGSGYINEVNGVPNQSVGFWIPDQDLTKKEFHGTRYDYPNMFGFDKSIKYVGLDTPIEKIPAGSLIRLSLARWWDTNGNTEERCSLQLSGWYDVVQTIVQPTTPPRLSAF